MKRGEEIRIFRHRGPASVRVLADTPKPAARRRVDWKRKLAEMPSASFNLEEAFAMITEERRRR